MARPLKYLGGLNATDDFIKLRSRTLKYCRQVRKLDGSECFTPFIAPAPVPALFFYYLLYNNPAIRLNANKVDGIWQ